MNLHPIIVHFPIALLVVYAIIEIITLIVPKRHDKLFTTKIITLGIGVVGSFAALSSGEVAEDIVGTSDLVHTHEERAEKAHTLYTILAIRYTIVLIRTQRIGASYRQSLIQPYTYITNKIITGRKTQYLVTTIAIIGVIMLTIVGALGGAIVRGVGTGDPITDHAVRLFVPGVYDDYINTDHTPTSQPSR